MLWLSAHQHQFLSCTLTHQATGSVRALLGGSREEQILIPEGTWKDIRFPRQTEKILCHLIRKSQLIQSPGIKIRAQVLLRWGKNNSEASSILKIGKVGEGLVQITSKENHFLEKKKVGEGEWELVCLNPFLYSRQQISYTRLSWNGLPRRIL